jgi:hypothetical protein
MMFTAGEKFLAQHAVYILVEDGMAENDAMEMIYAATLLWQGGDLRRDPVQYARHIVSMRKTQ